jgi:hypothetical protein
MQRSPVLVNISTRLRILQGDGILAGGFIISGSGSKRLLIRGLGPSLAAAGVEGTLADPTLELHDGATGAILSKNDNWQAGQATAIAATGVPPTNSAEAAMIVTLTQGAYTVIESGQNGGTGVGLVEIYDLTPGTGPELVNISTRGFVDQGENVMIAGFIVSGAAGGTSTIAVRALGPSLGDAGVANALPDPALALYNSDGELLAANDNWKANKEALEAVNLAPTSATEAALIATLAPGSYTAIETGTNGATGIGLVEIYNLH